MMKPCSILFALGLATAVAAQGQVQISLGVRETGAGGALFTSIGGNGGSSGGIEWIDRDVQTLTLDGTWQQFTFDLANATVTAFAGATANGVLDGAFGTIEHIRILNANGITDPITIWIDDVANTITPSGGSPTTTTFGDFEGYPAGTEVMFQEPSFSGSTSANLVAGSTAGVDGLVAARSASNRVAFQFVDSTPTRWVRLTTFNATNQPNSQIRFDQSSVVTFWMRGGKAEPNLGSQGPGTSIAEMVGTGLNGGQSSTYYTAGAPANAAGALAVSLAGQADVPFLGGNLVSFGGFVYSSALMADASGKFSFACSGLPAVFDAVLQTVFIDVSTPDGVAFTNAVRAEFGR